MPTLPGEAPTREDATSKRERPANKRPPRRSSPPPSADAVSRNTKSDESLRTDIAGVYILAGTIISLVRPTLGLPIAKYSDETAQAWIDLGKKKPQVRKFWEDLTAASAWAEVISSHMKIAQEALPALGGGGVNQEQQQPTFTVDPMGNAYATEEDMSRLAFDMAWRAMQGEGGPTDTVAAPTPPEYNPNMPAGMPTPEQLGAVNGSVDIPFPIDPSPPRGR